MPQDMRSRNGSGGNHMDDGHVAIPVDGAPLLPSEVAGYDKLTTPSGGPDSPNGSSHHGSSSHSSRHLQQQQQQQQLQENEETTSDLMHGINSFWAIVFPVCMTMVIASVVVVNYRNSSIEASMQYVYISVYGERERRKLEANAFCVHTGRTWCMARPTRMAAARSRSACRW